MQVRPLRIRQATSSKARQAMIPEYALHKTVETNKIDVRSLVKSHKSKKRARSAGDAKHVNLFPDMPCMKRVFGDK